MKRNANKKILLVLTISLFVLLQGCAKKSNFENMANANEKEEVALCYFKGDAIYDFENDKVECFKIGKGDELKWDSSGALGKITTIKNMYADGWKYGGYFNIFGNRYILISKGSKSDVVTEVGICKFIFFSNGNAFDKFECNGALKGITTMDGLEAKGWEKKDTYRAQGYSHVIFEKKGKGNK